MTLTADHEVGDPEHTLDHNLIDALLATHTSDIAGKQPLDSDLTAIAGLTPTNDDIVQRKSGAWANRSMSQLKTDLVLVKGDVGLGNVDNTSDVNKPVSTAQATADGLAVPKTLFDANTVLYATTDDTPAALTVGASTFVGRKASGNISAMSVSEVKTLLSLAISDVTSLQAGLDAKLAIQETVNAQSSVTGTYAIPDVTTATIHRLTLTGNTTFTFPTAAAGKNFSLVIVQDATGSRTVTWPTIKWVAATAPTLSTAANKIDVLSFSCFDGTNWLGFLSGLDMR